MLWHKILARRAWLSSTIEKNNLDQYGQRDREYIAKELKCLIIKKKIRNYVQFVSCKGLRSV